MQRYLQAPFWGLLCFFSFPLLLLANDSKPPVRATVEATLSEKGDTLSGKVTLTVTNNTQTALSQIPLWLYPNRFEEPNPSLDEGMLRWIYPAGKTRGGMQIKSPKWNKQDLPSDYIRFTPLYSEYVAKNDRIIANIHLPQALQPNESGQLSIDFQVTIPTRRGRFGRHRGVVSLAGGWFPRPLTDLTGKDHTLPPDVIEASVKLWLPANRGAVVGDHIYLKKEVPQVITVESITSEIIPVIVMDRMEISLRQYDWGKAIHVHQSLPWKAPTWRQSATDHNGMPDRIPEPGRFDISKRLLDIVGNTADLIQKMSPNCEIKKRLVLVDIPAWDHMVQLGPGPILVSDRLWRIIPVRDGRFFHDLTLVRAVASELTWRFAAQKESPQYRFVASDVIGSMLARHYSLTIHNKRRTVEEIIGPASMFPIVDNLLYAPQIPFREVYYRSVEEPDQLRDEPWRFMNFHPRGKRLIGKLQDLSDWDNVRESVGRLINGEVQFVGAIEKSLGEDAAWFLKQWYGAYPKVNYRIGTIDEKEQQDGQILHLIEIIREGAVIREPVVVRLTDKAGTTKDLVWDSDAHKTTLTWRSSSPIKRVVIDPDHRLVESASLTGDHPLSDNIRPLKWRPPMFTKLLVWADLTSSDPYVDISFVLRRKYDITNAFNLAGWYSTRSSGGSFGYHRYFGSKRTLNVRSWRIGPTFSAVRYNPIDDSNKDLSPEIRKGATMGALNLSVSRDSRTYGWDALSGTAYALGGTYLIGASDNQKLRQVGIVSGYIGKIASPGTHHTFAMYAGATGVLGNPVAGNMTSLAHREKLRGFDVDETFGKVSLYAVSEYRHTLRDAANVKAPLYSWFDRFQGVLFVGAGTVSKTDSYSGMFKKERLFTEVGYGLRMHLLFLGVAQYLLAFDVAVPITPLNRYQEVTQSDGSVLKTQRSPYRLIFGISQTF